MAQQYHSLLIIVILTLEILLLQKAESNDVLKSERAQRETFWLFKASRDDSKLLVSISTKHFENHIQSDDGISMPLESNQKVQEVDGNFNEKCIDCANSPETKLGHALPQVAQFTAVHFSALNHGRKLLGQFRRSNNRVTLAKASRKKLQRSMVTDKFEKNRNSKAQEKGQEGKKDLKAETTEHYDDEQNDEAVKEIYTGKGQQDEWMNNNYSTRKEKKKEENLWEHIQMRQQDAVKQPVEEVSGEQWNKYEEWKKEEHDTLKMHYAALWEKQKKHVHGNNNKAEWAVKEEGKTERSVRPTESHLQNGQNKTIEIFSVNDNDNRMLIGRKLKATEEVKPEELQVTNTQDKKVDEDKWEAKEEVKTEGTQTPNNEEDHKPGEGTWEQKGATVGGSQSENKNENEKANGAHGEAKETAKTEASDIKPESRVNNENWKPDDGNDNEPWKPNQDKPDEKEEVKTDGWRIETESSDNNEEVKNERSEFRGEAGAKRKSWKQNGDTGEAKEGNVKEKLERNEEKWEAKGGKTDGSNGESSPSNNNQDQKLNESGWEAKGEIETESSNSKSEAQNADANLQPDGAKSGHTETNLSDSSKPKEGGWEAKEGSNNDGKPNEAQWEAREGNSNDKWKPNQDESQERKAEAEDDSRNNNEGEWEAKKGDSNENWKPNEGELQAEKGVITKEEVKLDGLDGKSESGSKSGSNPDNWRSNEGKWDAKDGNTNENWKTNEGNWGAGEGNNKENQKPNEAQWEAKEEVKKDLSKSEPDRTNENLKPDEGKWEGNKADTNTNWTPDGREADASNEEKKSEHNENWPSIEGKQENTERGKGDKSDDVILSGNNNESWKPSEEVKSEGSDGKQESGNKNENSKPSEGNWETNNEVKTEESPSENEMNSSKSYGESEKVKKEERAEGPNTNTNENWKPDEGKWEGKEEVSNEASGRADINGQWTWEKNKEQNVNGLNSKPTEELPIKEEQKQKEHSGEQHEGFHSNQQTTQEHEGGKGDWQNKQTSNEEIKVQKDAGETDIKVENEKGESESKNNNTFGDETKGDGGLGGERELKNDVKAKENDEINGEKQGSENDLQVDLGDNQNQAAIATAEDSDSGVQISDESLEDDDYHGLIHEFSKLPSKFHETAGHVAQELLPEIHKFSQKSKDYFMLANQQIAGSFLPLVGKDYAPLVASMISYGILLLPLAVVIFFFERLRAIFSLQKILLVANIYLAGYFATLTLASFVLRAEPMSFFQKFSPSSFISLLLLQATGYLIYLFLGIVDLVKTCSGAIVCGKVLAFTNCFVGILIGLHYYVTVFHRAMARKLPQTSWKIYGIYCIFFLVLCSLARTQRGKKEYIRIGDYTTDKKN